MLHLVQSNKVEFLLASLLKTLAEQTFEGNEVDLNDAFSELLQPDTILVQSPGMSQWLKINIANTLKIAANIDFPLPSSYIWRLYDKRIDDLPEESAFNKNHLTWKILHLLPQLLHKSEFANIKHYLAHSECEDIGEQLKGFQLAAKIADVYDQYLMYRPDWIMGWEQGKDDIVGGDIRLQPWQPVLWRAIIAYSTSLREPHWHRANMHEALISQLAEGEPDNQTSQPKPLYVFGISTMPSQQLEILQAIAIHREVYIYWFNPSHHFWADVVDNRKFEKQQLSLFNDVDDEHESQVTNSSPLKKYLKEKIALLDVGNPLLASWGKPGQDFLAMISDLNIEQEDLFDEPSAENLLCWVQKEIYELSFRGSRQPLKPKQLLSNSGKHPKKRITAVDQSIEIHAVHSRIRELEVLKDQICHWFETGQISDIGEIIIMMPDVAGYAPLIDAVFSRPTQLNNETFRAEAPENSDKQRPQQSYIPFAISDRTQMQEDTLIQSFLQLMGLQHARLTLTDVFELIKVPEISARYQLSNDEIAVLHHWCQSAGIRWGWSGEQKQQWGLPEEPQNTWVFGIKRLLSGFASFSSQLIDEEIVDEEIINQDILPVDEIEGQNTQALGRLLAFLEDVSLLAEFCQGAHTLSQKVTEALMVIDSFYQVDSDNEYRLQKLKESVAKLLEHQSQYVGKISQQVFLAVLKETLSQSGVGQRFLAGKLNFCTLMPMRSIPFKHVCILGLNEADYPRQTVPISFDLMNSAAPRKGDRSRRLDDRYLFLEALLSAREKLYISYIGRSDRNNELREPSILVSELIEYCQQSTCLEDSVKCSVEDAEQQLKTHLLTRHPLQPWSAEYFATFEHESKPSNNTDNVFSYDKDMCHLAAKQQDLELSGPFVINENLLTENALTENPQQILPDVVELDSVLQFFRNPVKSWFRSTWKTQFPALHDAESDQEPLYLDPLERYQVAQSILLGEDNRQVILQLQKAGVLPVGNLKQIELEYLQTRVNLIRDKLMSLTEQISPGPEGIADPMRVEPMNGEPIQTNSAHAPNSITKGNQLITRKWVQSDVSVAGANITLAAPITLLAEQHLLLFRPGKLGANDRLRTWLMWCLFCVCEPGENKQAWFLAEDKTLRHDALEPEEAKSYLQQILQYYLAGQDTCLPFFPRTSLNWAEQQDMDKALQAYIGNDFVPGEGLEQHNQRVFPLLSEVWSEFSAMADSVFQPMLMRESIQ